MRRVPTLVTEGTFTEVDVAFVCGDNNGTVVRVQPRDGVLVLPEFDLVCKPSISQMAYDPDEVARVKRIADQQLRTFMRETCEACEDAFLEEVGYQPDLVVLLDKGRVETVVIPDHEWEFRHIFGAAAFSR